MATVKLKEIATDITWGDATRDINENNRKIQVALATVAAAGEGDAAWGESTTESAELIIGGSGTKVVSLDGHTHETSEVNGLDAKLAQTDASIDSLKSSDTAIKGQISGVNASISDLYNRVQDVDEGGVKKTDLKTLTVNVNGTKVGEYDTKADKTINITADMLGLSGAMAFVGVTVTAISQGSTQNEIGLDDSTTYTAKTGDVVIYGKREFVWTGEHWQELGDEQSFALKSITVTGTGYLTGGGNLEANRTIDIATSVKTKIDNGDAALTKATALETNLANNYPTKNGTGASGTWGIDISGKAASADKVANALTFNSAGAGAASGSTYDGSGAKTISYNTVGAAKAAHSHAFSDITGKPTTLAGYGITDGASDAELSAHANNTDIHLAVGDRENIEAALVMASDVSSELTVILEGYDTTPTLSTELGKKADISDLTAHTGNTTVHITASERSSWNAKYSKPATGIPVDDMEAGVAESLANADLALADVGALSQNFIAHESDTTVHITANERKAWNAKADASTLNSHTGNTEIHTTSAEKASWNNKYDKPSTGIPITDLESGIQESIGNADAALENSTNALAQISYHEDDMVKHITAEERSAWNGKANTSDLNAHTGNSTIHITSAERSKWNAKYDKPSTGIPIEDLESGIAESLGNADLALADVGALSQNFINHEGDTTVHITASERTAWNGKADESDLTAHTGNTTIHITASERSSWNAKYSKPATGIPVDDMEAGVAESLANADLALADVGALSQNFIAHESDTTVHITANERKAWNAKADASTLNSHTGNTEIHTTSAEKASWNNKYDKPSTGIPITDLESGIQESIGNADAALENSTNALAQISYHEDDMVKHITAEERSAWNGKANTSDLNAHTGNSTIHITSAERSKWNAKYDKPSTGIPIEDLESGIAESLGNADLALADVGALSQNFINHEGDTTVHITASERTAWNGKANASTLNSHTGNTTIHTTAEEKASWNGKYTKPEGGIPAEDLSGDVNASINSGSMSYELASEANGKVSLLLGSYGAEIPDLKNELGKKQDKLVSGTSIKTVNGESLLGRGNITTPKTTVVDNLTSTSETDALSANQGKVLNEKFADVVTQADVVNSLGSTEQKKPLSAFMGKVLSDRLNNGDFIAKEAKMQWGGRNNNDQNLSPVEALLIERPSRTIFGNAEGVKVEYSTNGGSTWNAYTDNSNYGLLLRPYNVTPFSLGGSSDRGKSTTDMLRITLNAKGIGVYLGNIRKIYFYGGQTNARSLKVVLESRKAVGGVSGGGDNEFEVVQTLDSFSAWPGWGFLSVNDSGFGTWSHSETYNNNNIIEYRLTFSINNLYTTDYDAPYIARVGIYSTGIYESLEYAQMYGNPLVLHDDGYIHADRELYLTKRVQAQNIQVSNLNVTGSLNYTRARVETSEASVTLDASKYTVINCGGDLTINLPNGYSTDGKEYVCEIRTGSIGPTVSFPSDIKFAFGDNFVSGFQPDSVYQISIQNSLAVVIPFV